MFVYYLIHESDFIEILMTGIAEAVHNLPDQLDPLDLFGNFNLLNQILDKSPLLVETQLQDLQNHCRLVHQVFISLDIQVQSYLSKREKPN